MTISKIILISLALLTTQSYLLCADEDAEKKITKSDAFKLICTMPLADIKVSDFTIHPNKELFAYASDDRGQICVSEIHHGEAHAKWIAFFKQLQCEKILFNPNSEKPELAILGKLIKKDKDLSRSFEGLSILDVETGEITAHHGIHEARHLLNLAFNDDGTLLAITVCCGGTKGLYVYAPQDNYKLYYTAPIEARVTYSSELTYLDNDTLVLGTMGGIGSAIHEIVYYHKNRVGGLEKLYHLMNESLMYPRVKSNGEILCQTQAESDNRVALGTYGSEEFRFIPLQDANEDECNAHIWAYDNERGIIYGSGESDDAISVWLMDPDYNAAKKITDLPFGCMRMRQDGAYIIGCDKKNLAVLAVLTKRNEKGDEEEVKRDLKAN